ncbi:MAG: ankyrin repeat domain-containing protein [Dokdonia sp.]|jgi:ankyrin repeat protein
MIIRMLFVLLLFTGSLLAQDVYQIARSGDTAQMEEVYTQNPQLLRQPNADGYLPLTLAAYHDNINIVRYLIDKEVPLDNSSSYGSALMAATVKGSKAIVALLLENGANPNIADANGTTALIYASLFQLNDIAGLLLKYKANPHAKDNRNNTALDYAVLTQNNSLITLLKNQ